MKIAMISYHTCPLASQEGKETGGMNIYVLELSRALARKGHQIDIFTRSHEANDALITQTEANLRVIHLPAGPQAPVAKKKQLAFIPTFVREYLVFVQTQKMHYDFMHAHYYQSGLAAMKIIKHIPTPFVMSFHTLALMKNLVARDTLEKESIFRIEAEMKLARAAQKIIASSESDKEYMQYLYDVPQEKISVVSPGIDTTIFHPMDKTLARTHIHAHPDHKIALFVGRVEPLKGIDTLLYAMKIIKKKYPGHALCLWIVGGDTSEDPSRWTKTLRELDRLQKTLSLTGDVHFVGQQPQHELPYFYNAADVVVMPSHYESFGMAALEAMGCGVPVITTNVAGISSRIHDQYKSLVSTVNNPLLLASQIEHVLADPSLSKTFAQETQKNIRDLQWSHGADKMIEIYNGFMQKT